MVMLPLSCCIAAPAAAPSSDVPAYLRDYAALYRKDPRAAGQAWFRDAKFGLFVSYGMVSLLPRGKAGLWPEEPPPELCARFTAEKFDANAIAELAVEAGMRYVCFTAFHGGGPYNFRSAVAHPNSFDDLPAKRDLLAELAEACRKRGLGLFIYVHWKIALSSPDVWERNREIVREWCTNYGPLAGFWFDTDSNYYKNKEQYPKLDETYRLIRSLQPQALISFCHGVTGDEDYITYEHRFHAQSEFPFVPDKVKQRLADKTVELCTTMQLNEKGGKGVKMWFNVEGAYHRDADEIWQALAEARRDGCNLLLNIGPLGDGSVPVADAATLREVGRRLRESGFPVSKKKGSILQEGEDR